MNIVKQNQLNAFASFIDQYMPDMEKISPEYLRENPSVDPITGSMHDIGSQELAISYVNGDQGSYTLLEGDISQDLYDFSISVERLMLHMRVIDRVRMVHEEEFNLDARLYNIRRNKVFDPLLDHSQSLIKFVRGEYLRVIANDDITDAEKLFCEDLYKFVTVRSTQVLAKTGLEEKGLRSFLNRNDVSGKYLPSLLGQSRNSEFTFTHRKYKFFDKGKNSMSVESLAEDSLVHGIFKTELSDFTFKDFAMRRLNFMPTQVSRFLQRPYRFVLKFANISEIPNIRVNDAVGVRVEKPIVRSLRLEDAAEPVTPVAERAVPAVEPTTPLWRPTERPDPSLETGTRVTLEPRTATEGESTSTKIPFLSSPEPVTEPVEIDNALPFDWAALSGEFEGDATSITSEPVVEGDATSVTPEPVEEVGFSNWDGLNRSTSELPVIDSKETDAKVVLTPDDVDLGSENVDPKTTSTEIPGVIDVDGVEVKAPLEDKVPAVSDTGGVNPAREIKWMSPDEVSKLFREHEEQKQSSRTANKPETSPIRRGKVLKSFDASVPSDFNDIAPEVRKRFEITRVIEKRWKYKGCEGEISFR